jgi:long-chain acyl-CoA synthetase
LPENAKLTWVGYEHQPEEGTLIDPSGRADIPGRFRAVAQAQGARVGIHGEGGLTYAELDRRSDGLARALIDAGASTGAITGAGERVGLLCPNGADFVVAYLGVLKAGATVVPLNLMLNPREVAFILADSGACALIHHHAFDAAAAEATAGGRLRLRVRIGDGPPAGMHAFSDLVETPGVPPTPTIDPAESVAVILYTSGTTGRPKGAMLTHANLVANATGVAAALGFTPDDRVLVVLPMFHAFAATVGVLTPLLHGGGLIPVARFEPRLVSQTIAEHGATLFLGVPSMYGVLFRLDEESVGRWRGVRLCVSGGAALPEAVLRGFESRFGIPIAEGDGPTECSPVTCVNPPEGPRKPGSVGPPIPGVEMRILDAEGREVADGSPGEVCVRGPSVMKGYWNLPEATRESFFGEWFRTGDLGTRDADGYFYLVDRIKDLIIVNGMNVYPRVIEEVLYAHPAVAEAAVVGDPDPRHGEIPVAHVALRPGADVASAPAELRDWCRERLGRHEVPRRFLIRESLPRNAAGKILKRELRVIGEHERGVSRPPLDR